MTDERATPEQRDPAAEAGRLTGRAVSPLGLRLLRLRSVRLAIQRATEESRSAEPVAPPPQKETQS
ncbi:MAG TPA: hypothetical protein VGO86_04285 [Candidatus Dormibacteraeota bacterium]